LRGDGHWEGQAPYAFTNKLGKVVFDLKPTTHAEAKALHEHEHHRSVGSSVGG